MSENKPSVSGEDSFDAFLSANLPEEAAPDISSRVTPWADALRLILLSICGIRMRNQGVCVS